MKNNLLKSSLAALLIATPVSFVSGQNIVLEGTGGSGDIFFLYESQANSGDGAWHTVFRAKGTTGEPTTTNASGLTNSFQSFTGVSGTNTVIVPNTDGHTGDYNFDTLRVNVNTNQSLNVGGTDFYYTHTNGEFENPNPNVPDLGIRFRLREDQDAMGIGSNSAFDQFDNFTFTLNTAQSTFNGIALQDTTAHVSLFGNLLGSPDVLFNSAAGDLTGTFNSVWGHHHRNWGFSEYGEYSVVLDVLGVGGEYGDSAHQATIDFTVAIPEPGTYAAIFGFLALAGVLMVRHRRNKSS
ncbi:MAG: hypothetical protein LAT55_11615 [Opitutales bacterium]|nr:hypothetical protein [Opitutales bacterium]